MKTTRVAAHLSRTHLYIFGELATGLSCLKNKFPLNLEASYTMDGSRTAFRYDRSVRMKEQENGQDTIVKYRLQELHERAMSGSSLRINSRLTNGESTFARNLNRGC